MDIYREQLLDHYHQPRGWGLAATASVQERGANLPCGDILTLQLDLAGDIITATRFDGHGCVVSIAATSLLVEYLNGKTVGELNGLTLDFMQELLAVRLPAPRVGCALLGLTTLQRAVAQHVIRV